MNWNQDWDQESNSQGWHDGRNGGMRTPSVLPLPRSVSNAFGRLVLIVIVVVGLAGAAFAAYQCIGLVHRIVSQPHSPSTHHKRS
jgi:hypothetical protein